MTQLPAPSQQIEFPAPPTTGGSSRMTSAAIPWVPIAILALLFAAIFWPVAPRLFRKSLEPNWQHSLLVPLVSLLYLFRNRKELFGPDLTTPHWRWQGFGVLCMGVFIDLAATFVLWAYRPTLFGSGGPEGFIVHLAFHVPLWLLAGGLLQVGAIRRWTMELARTSSLWFGLLCTGLAITIHVTGATMVRNHFVVDAAMILTLFGLVLLVGGWKIMRVAWFPIVFLLCAIPWPPLLYSRVAMPLQELAAECAVLVLQLTGVAAERHGTIIDTPVRPLDVAEACAGMKSLMTFFALGGAVAFLSGRPMWQRLVIWASSVPIAIFCNVARVSGQGLMDYYVSQSLTTGVSHALVGLLMMIPAFFLLLSVGWVIDLYVNTFWDQDDGSRGGSAAASAGGAGVMAIESPSVITRKRRKTADGRRGPQVSAPPGQPAPPPTDLTSATQRLTSSTLKRPAKPQAGGNGTSPSVQSHNFDIDDQTQGPVL